MYVVIFMHILGAVLVFSLCYVQALVCVMGSLLSLLCAGFSLCSAKFLVCVMCRLQSVLCEVSSLCYVQALVCVM